MVRKRALYGLQFRRGKKKVCEDHFFFELKITLSLWRHPTKVETDPLQIRLPNLMSGRISKKKLKWVFNDER